MYLYIDKSMSSSLDVSVWIITTRTPSNIFKDVDLKLSSTSIKVPRKLSMCNQGIMNQSPRTSRCNLNLSPPAVVLSIYLALRSGIGYRGISGLHLWSRRYHNMDCHQVCIFYPPHCTDNQAQNR
jgi:hypothetical protein